MNIRKFDVNYLPKLAPILNSQRTRIEVADQRLPHCLDTEPIISQLAKRMKESSAIGYLAEQNGKPLAFMLATPTSHEPNSYMANFFPLRYANISFVVGKIKDATKTLYRLYTVVAQEMMDAGYTIHFAKTLAVEDEILNLWAELGFGRKGAHAGAKLTELPTIAPEVNGLNIRRATESDTSLIRHFFELMQEWHTRSPIFHPLRQSAIPTVYAKLEEELKDPHYAHFIAELNGKPIGICDGYWAAEKDERVTLIGHSPYAYLRNGLTLPESHGKGIGRAVCLAFYNWICSECDAPYLYLDYYTTNPASRNFWLAQGFRSITYGLQRVIPQEEVVKKIICKGKIEREEL